MTGTTRDALSSPSLLSHVAQNVAAASIALSDDEVAAISKGG